MAREREGGRGREHSREERDSELVDQLVHINRVAKVVKGGRRFGFAALLGVGDQKGRVGYGPGKAREVPEAIRKATEAAKRGTSATQREGRTLHHDVNGRYGAGRWCCARPRPAPASSPAGRCARCSRRSACTSRRHEPGLVRTPTTWSGRPSPRCPRGQPGPVAPPQPKVSTLHRAAKTTSRRRLMRHQGGPGQWPPGRRSPRTGRQPGRAPARPAGDAEGPPPQ